MCYQIGLVFFDVVVVLREDMNHLATNWGVKPKNVNTNTYEKKLNYAECWKWMTACENYVIQTDTNSL